MAGTATANIRDTLIDRAAEAPVAKTPLPFVLASAGVTDCGRVRRVNQDQFAIVTITGSLWVERTSFDQPRVQCSRRRANVFIVADGMGGHAGGQQASELAVQAVESYLVEMLGSPGVLADRGATQRPLVTHVEDPDDAPSSVRARPSLFEYLERAMQHADDVVISEAHANPELSNMGTTMTIACIVNDDLYIAHAGDSRCYLWRNGGLTQITRDHTLVGQLLEAGVLTQEEAKNHHMRHVVTNVVGGGRAGVATEVHAMKLALGDGIIMCSDGLSETVSLEQMAEILLTQSDPGVACNAMIDAANEAGSPDNVTVVIASLAVPPGLRRTEPGQSGEPARKPFDSGWFEGARGGIIGHGMP
jgi:serine/threonine protein phosphatase PrpC